MFKAQQLVKALEESSGEELKNGDPVDLELTGNLKDDTATPIKGLRFRQASQTQEKW
jgi:hypothetical protein